MYINVRVIWVFIHFSIYKEDFNPNYGVAYLEFIDIGLLLKPETFKVRFIKIVQACVGVKGLYFFFII